MKRRTVLATVGATAVTPLLAGCSDPGTTIGLEPGTVEVAGSAGDDEGAETDGDEKPRPDDDWTWDVTYELAYQLEGLDEADGLYEVTTHLVDGRGVELARVDHGDLAWDGLSDDERETGEYEDGVEYYRADRRESASATVERFPRWILFTVDRAVGSGVWMDVDVLGATTDVIVPSPVEGGGAQSRPGDGDADRDATSDGGANETELSVDPDGMVVPDEYWERIRQDRYDSYPPIDEIPSNAESPGNDGGATNGSRTDQ